MGQLTMGNILAFVSKLKDEGMTMKEINNLPIYLGDDDELNGIHCMNSMQKWSEGDVYINIDTDKVDFCVYSGYEDLEEYIEERKSWDDEFDEKEF